MVHSFMAYYIYIYMHIVAKHTAMSVNVLHNFSVFIAHCC